jgi:dihydrofolate reductase
LVDTSPSIFDGPGIKRYDKNMQVILDMVLSPNGFIAREDGNEDWLPEEGWDEFVTEAKRHDNIVMGRETYEQVTRRYEEYNFDSVDVAHKIIVTAQPEFTAPEGYVVVHSPEEAIEYLEKKDVKTLFLIGGGVLNAAFAKRSLVTNLQLTIAPHIIGKGRPVLAFDDFELALTLIDVQRLSLDRVRLSYTVNRN